MGRRAAKIRVQPQRVLEQPERLGELLGRVRPVVDLKPPQQHLVGSGVVGAAVRNGIGRVPDQAQLERVGDAAHHLVLQREDLRPAAVEAVRPDMARSRAVDELGVDAHDVADAPEGAFEQIAHAELRGDRRRRRFLVLVGEGGIARHDEQAGNARQLGRQVLGEPVGQIALGLVVAEIVERQHDQRRPRVGRRARCRRRALGAGPRTPPGRPEPQRHQHQKRCGGRQAWPGARLAADNPGKPGLLGPQHDAIGLDRLRQVLDALLAEQLEAESQRLLDLPRHLGRDADAARLRQLLQPGRHVDAFAVAVVAVDDHLAEVDADPELDPRLLGDAGVPFGQATLHRDRALDGVDDAAELGEQPVAHQLEDAAMVPFDRRLDQPLALAEQRLERARLVALHQGRIAHDVGGEDGG